jgi:IS30 family transposase
MRSYKHLTLDQKCTIAGLLSIKKSVREIAKIINVNPSTVSREIKRNSASNIYQASIAHDKYQNRKKENGRPTVLTPAVRCQVLLGLKNYHSPEQISGSLKLSGINISHETIYKFVWKEKSLGADLHKYLRHGGKKYNKRSGVYSGRGLIPARVDIDEREAIVDTKSRIGDWEADTVIGAGQSGVIVTLVERHSKILLSKLVANKTKDVVTQAICEMLKPYKDKVLTITYDNGGEFAGHEIIGKTLDAKCYFAKPYHSWERGLNEHTNGLLRQFIPKKMPFTNLTENELAKYQNLINNRPRKILNFNTPNKVFLSPTVALAA